MTTLKLISWNANGIRSLSKKGLPAFVAQEQPDILCLQETKLDHREKQSVPDIGTCYRAFYCSAQKKGYSGVVTFVREGLTVDEKSISTGIGVKKVDTEGRFLISDHKKFILYNVYIPSGTTGEERQQFKYSFLDKFLRHLKSLPQAQFEKLVICGDFNICHKDIDIHHPQEAKRRGLSGFLPDERKWLDQFTTLGFIDTFRLIHGDVKGQYSWWTFRAGAREKNLGWRIDYIFVHEKFKKGIRDATILTSVSGSDHCPISVELAI